MAFGALRARGVTEVRVRGARLRASTALLFTLATASLALAQPRPPDLPPPGGPLSGRPITAPPALAPPQPQPPAANTLQPPQPNRAQPNPAQPNAPLAPPAGPPPPLAPTAPPPPAAAPQAPKPADKVIRPTLDKTKGFVGDLFNYTLQLTHDPAERYLVPAEPAFKPFDVRGRDFYKRTLEDGRVEETFVFRIAVYKVGAYRTPPIDIPFVTRDGRTLRAVAQELDITIESVLPAGPELPPLKDVKAPMHLVVRDWRLLWLAGILGALGLLALFAWLAYRYGKKIAARERPAPPPPPPRPAHLIAYEKLAVVTLPTTDGELRTFYESVSNIVREYCGNRYGFLALDMTTGEILKMVKPISAGGRAPGLHLMELQSFLSDADLVKFAKFVPGSNEPQDYLATGRRIVDATRAPDEEPSAPAGPAAQASARAPRKAA